MVVFHKGGECMTITDCKFIYADVSSDVYDVYMCQIGSNVDTDSNDEASNLITSTTPYIDNWHLHGKNKSEPLKFNITIAQKDGNYIDSYKERELKKWLCKNKYNWLQVMQDDLYDIQYNCILVNPQKVNVARMSAGLRFNVICNSDKAWTGLRNKLYTSINSFNFDFNLSTDYDDYILYPTLIIKPTLNGDISIKNNVTNKVLTIKDCVSTETIIIDNNYNIITSDKRILLDKWNKQYFNLIEGINNITLIGNFTMEMQYRLPVRVGG